jgi:hypothetical protein
MSDSKHVSSSAIMPSSVAAHLEDFAGPKSQTACSNKVLFQMIRCMVHTNGSKSKSFGEQHHENKKELSQVV